ncbi:hypothetical protein KHA80_17850 [Anaerobacillus sp. HL2]|nr:hypothetical protein KHA80_17850 [Anaerobacillus sp. HL2]
MLDMDEKALDFVSAKNGYPHFEIPINSYDFLEELTINTITHDELFIGYRLSLILKNIKAFP